MKERKTLGQTIHLYHTNDLHSHFEKWPQIAYFLKKQKEHHKQKGESCFLFDIGDHVDRFHPISEATKGKANIDLLNDLHYDAVTIGNNEGITLAHNDLDTLYKQARFPVIVSNLYNQDGRHPNWVKPYEIFTAQNGIKIGVIGATVYYEKFYELLGWSIQNPMDRIKMCLDEIRGKVDIIILLSHLGLSDDEWIADEFPEIDVVLGGHTHHVLKNGKKIKQTMLACAGKYGQWVGHVEIFVNNNKSIKDVKAELIETNRLKEDEQTREQLREIENKAQVILNKPVALLNQPLKLDWFSDSPFAKLLARALKEWCSGEVSMINAGVLLESLPSGMVKKGDLHRICPHPINPCLVHIKGDQLKEVILQARLEKMEQLQLKGLGFRGKVMGRMVFEGIEVEEKRLNDGKYHVQDVRINNERLDPNRVYRVATLDMFTLGPLYPELSHANEKTYFMPEMLRDILEWKLRGNRPF